MAKITMDPSKNSNSNKLRKLALQSIAEGIICIHETGIITFCNPGGMHLLGYESLQQLIHKNLADLLVSDRNDSQAIKKVSELQCHSPSESKQGLVRICCSDFSAVSFEFCSFPLVDKGRSLGTVVQFTPVNHQPSSARVLHTMIAEEQSAIVGANFENRIISWNRAAQNMYGYSQAEVIGQPLSIIFDSGGPDGQSRTSSNHDGATSDGVFQAIRRHKRGDLLTVSVAASPIIDIDQKQTGTIFVERNITDQQEQIERSHHAEHNVKQAEAMANASHALRAQFLANVSHELRTPMNAILGMLELAIDEADGESLLDYLKTAKSSANSLLELVNDILDFSKIESGKFEVESTPFDPREIIDQTAKSLSTKASEKGLEIFCEIDSKIPRLLRGDRRRLQQVLINLLSNAVKFTETGEIIVEAVQLSRMLDQTRIRFSVTDTGIGIYPEDQQRIFTPFAQGDMSTTRLHHGTGLGLSIASELVNLMGGSLALSSQKFVGSSFSFTLTLPVEDESNPVEQISLQLPDNLTVLIVDDNSTSLRILEKIFSNWSMHPLTASSALQATKIIERTPIKERGIALALVDGMMPGVDGFEFAEKLAKNSAIGSPPVVIMQSAADRALFSGKKKDASVARYIAKPISQSELLNVVVDVLDLYRTPAFHDRARPSSLANKTVKSLSILLVEDLEANRKVAERILEKRGHQVTTANNGRLALECIYKASTPFDVVLMDVQMPIMDGFQTTAAIRKMNDVSVSQIPIIAMTAHAMHGDREKCLAAGMDAYVTKPLDATRLVESVESIARNPRESNSADVKAIAAEFLIEIEPVFGDNENFELVDIDFSMSRLGDDRELFIELVNIFLEDAPELMNAISAGIRDKDADSLLKNAHAIKGLIANFGNNQCRQLAQELENDGREQNLDHAAEIWDDFENLFNKLCAELNTIK
jgi:two-component system, sensor histidine kinase and response regulator